MATLSTSKHGCAELRGGCTLNELLRFFAFECTCMKNVRGFLLSQQAEVAEQPKLYSSVRPSTNEIHLLQLRNLRSAGWL